MNKRAHAVFLLLSAHVSACAHGWAAHEDRPTCVVLSAGGPAGLAHLGAIQAIRDTRLPVSCVSGTSMGALVGALYASAPRDDLTRRYQALLADYRSRTEVEIGRNALIGGFLGAVMAGIMTGGTAALPLALGASAGAASAVQNTARVDLQRFGMVLESFTHQAAIDELPLRYASFHQERSGNGLVLVTVSHGPLAAAVARSMANPFIFEGFDPVAAGFVDPGGDRLAAIPVEDTCRAFPRARLLAINVTGQDIVHSQNMKCPLLEVKIDVGAVDADALGGQTASFDAVVRQGEDITRARLEQAGLRVR